MNTIKKEFIYSVFKTFIIHLVIIFGIVFSILFLPIIITSTPKNTNDIKMFNDGKTFARSENQWYYIDGKNIKMSKGKVIIYNDEKTFFMQLSLCIILLFFLILLWEIYRPGIKTMWLSANKINIKRVYYDDGAMVQTLSGRIVAVKRFGSASPTENYPLVYDKVAIRTKLIDNILK